MGEQRKQKKKKEKPKKHDKNQQKKPTNLGKCGGDCRPDGITTTGRVWRS